MTPAETGMLLVKAAAFDQRTVGEGDAIAWHEAIGHLPFRNCLAAVTVHYRTEVRRIVPADVVAIVKQDHQRRLDHAWRVEEEALRDVDADDPRAVIAALKAARQAAVTEPETVPDRPALPSRHEPAETAAARRAHQGAAECRRILEEIAAKRDVNQVLDSAPGVHERAVLRARAERGRPEPPPVRQEPSGQRRWDDAPAPASDDVAALATRYLIDGWTPAEVAARLGVSREWCSRVLMRVRRGPGVAS